MVDTHTSFHKLAMCLCPPSNYTNTIAPACLKQHTISSCGANNSLHYGNDHHYKDDSESATEQGTHGRIRASNVHRPWIDSWTHTTPVPHRSNLQGSQEEGTEKIHKSYKNNRSKNTALQFIKAEKLPDVYSVLPCRKNLPFTHFIRSQTNIQQAMLKF